MPKILDALKVEVAETTPAAFVCKKPAPVPRVKAEVEAPALNVCRALYVLAVVVPKPIEKTPVPELYASG